MFTEIRAALSKHNGSPKRRRDRLKRRKPTVARDSYTRGRDPYDAATARPTGDYVPIEKLLAVQQQLAATQAKLYNAENGPTWSNTTRIPDSPTKAARGSPTLLQKIRELETKNENLEKQKVFKQQLLNKKSKVVKELVTELKALKGAGKKEQASSSTEAQIEGYKKMISGLIKGHERKNEYIRDLQRKLGMKNPDVIRKPNAPKESAKPAKGNSPKTYALVPTIKAKKAGKKANKAPKKEKTSPLNATAKSFKPKKAAAKQKAAPKKRTSPRAATTSPKAAKSPRTSPKAARTSPKAIKTSPKDPKELVKELLRQNAELKKKNEGQQEFIRNSKAFMKKVKEEKQQKRN
jgi:hypothetical protein